MTQARLELDSYTIRVLDVVKGKFGLKNRNDALRKLIEVHGNDYAEMMMDEKILQELDATYDAHEKKHRNRRMNAKELDILLGLT